MATGGLNAPRDGYGMTLLLDGQVLVTGSNGDSTTPNAAGEIGPGPSSRSAEVYDPKTGVFSPVGDMTAGRTWHTSTLLADGRVLIAGGEAGTSDGSVPSKTLSSAEIYDPGERDVQPDWIHDDTSGVRPSGSGG